MSKRPLAAIIGSVILLILIYLFADIRPPDTDNAVPVVDTGTMDNLTAQEHLDNFASGLSESNALYYDSLLNDIETNDNSESKLRSIDSLIVFFEKNEQYNYAAFYHSKLAEIKGGSDAWELAGDRQLSVSRNAAYNPGFNQLLHAEYISSFQRAVEEDSTDLDLKVKLASAFLDKEEQTMQGITLLLDVVKKDSMHVDANIFLARFGIISAQYDKALNRLENILSLQPENTEALFLKGEVLSGMGNNQGAIEVFTECRDLIEDETIKADIDLLINSLRAE